MKDPTHHHKRIVLYSSDEKDKKANAGLLIALYAVSFSLVAWFVLPGSGWIVFVRDLVGGWTEGKKGRDQGKLEQHDYELLREPF